MAKKSQESEDEQIRLFMDNSSKELLRDPRNLRELLALLRSHFKDRIDFSSMKVNNNDFINLDYRNFKADVVLTANLLDEQGKPIEQVTVTILVENQSQPDALMVFWTLVYMVQIWLEQYRAAVIEAGTTRLKNFKFTPVLPVVFYTGSRTWKTLDCFSTLFQQPELFEQFLPKFETLFFTLPEMSGETLHDQGNALGDVLYLIQASHRQAKVFVPRLKEVVAALDQMQGLEEDRRSALIRFIFGLIFNKRKPSEHDNLVAEIEKIVSPTRRQETLTVGKTIAQDFIQRGRKEGHKEGHKEGIEKGVVIGRIHLCQRRLKRKETPTEDLEKQSVAELTLLADQLEAELFPATGKQK